MMFLCWVTIMWSWHIEKRHLTEGMQFSHREQPIIESSEAHGTHSRATMTFDSGNDNIPRSGGNCGTINVEKTGGEYRG
jgi:hypothetical protein